MELSQTGYVILGLLAWRPMSGYDIKAIADKSTRFFWAISYGQIYPELSRLAEAGLVKGERESDSGRRRTVYEITGEGRRALRGWLNQAPRTFETRDEGLLKLFLADAAPESGAGSLNAKRAYHEGKLAQLREIEASGHVEGFTAVVLRYGIDSSEWSVAWCEREARRLREAS